MSRKARRKPSPSRARGPDESRPGPDRAFWLASALIFLVVIVAYWPTLNNGFVDRGDPPSFLDSPDLRRSGPSQATGAFTSFEAGVYQPLTRIIQGFEGWLWGLDPRGYHGTSLALHGLVAIALAALAIALIERRRPALDESARGDLRSASAVAAIAFAVHPLRVEAVAWASSQSDLLGALFMILAVLAYLKAQSTAGPPDRRWLAGSIGLGAAALMSSALAFILPLILLILDVEPLGRIGPGRWNGPSARRVYLEKLPMAVLSLMVLVLAIAARESVRRPFANRDFGPETRLILACYGSAFAIFKTILPLDLSISYPIPRRVTWLDPPFLLSIGLVVGLSLILILKRRRWPAALAAWAAYLAGFLAVLVLARSGEPFAADRASYVPMLGLSVLLAVVLARPASPVVRRRLLTSVFGGSLLLIGLTWAQCRAWRDSTTLWTHALTPGHGQGAAPYKGLGRIAARRRDHAEAARRFGEAVQHDPGDAEAHNSLGTALGGLGRLDEASREFAEAVRLDPGSAEARNNYGVALARRRLFAEAAAQFEAASRLDPGLKSARENFARVQQQISAEQAQMDQDR